MPLYQILIFPLCAVLISALSYAYPALLADYVTAIVPLLGIVMFAMGMSLQFSDFKNVLLQPRLIALGIVLQYFLMPFIAWSLAQLLGLSPWLATGLILVGACPGGTASNIICYLARGNVALSITLTAFSTMLAVILTPFITYTYVEQSIEVPMLKMIKSLLIMIVFPVLTGVLINSFYQSRLAGIKRILPIVSMVSVILIIGIIVARSQIQLQQLGLLVIIAVVLHNLLGLLSGYWAAKCLRYDEMTAKTIAIEVGMQNSGLGIVLANQYFSAMAALPGVLFSIWHNISGALLATIWARNKKEHG